MKLSRIVFLLALPFSAIATVLMAVACLVAYHPEVSNYFDAGNSLPIMSAVLVCLAIVSAIVSVILSKRLSEPFAKPSVPSYSSLFTAIGALTSAILLFVAKEPLSGVLFLLTAAFFALASSPLAKRYAPAILWLGFASVAATVVLNATYYFDMTVEMNAPVKVILQMGLLAAMLDCTVEMRILIGQSNDVLTPIITTFSVALCGMSAVFTAVAQIGGKLPGMVYFAAMPFLWGVLITVFPRLCRLIFASTSQTITSEGSKTEEMRDSE